MMNASRVEASARSRSTTPVSANSGLDGLLDVARLAELLGVSERFVRRLVDERRIPFHKIGKFVRFRPEEVTVWVARSKVDAVN